MQKPAESTSQRIVKAVRKIAKTAQEEDGRLGIATPKAAIDKTRGVAFYNANGDMDSTDGDIPADAKKDNESDDDSTTKDGESPLITDDLQPGDDAGEFKAYDCTTGQELNIDLAPIPGQEYPTPDGWDGYDQPPVDPLYDPAYYWENDDTNSIHATPGAAHAAWQAYREPLQNTHPRYSYTYRGPEKSSDTQYFSYEDRLNSDSGGVSTTSDYHFRRSCSSDHDAICDLTPEEIFGGWPDDGKADLALLDGGFAAYEGDPDAPQVYKDSPPSDIEVCDGLGRRYSLTALEDGESMITRVDSFGNVDPDGHSVIVGNDGVVADRIGNAVRNSYLP